MPFVDVLQVVTKVVGGLQKVLWLSGHRFHEWSIIRQWRGERRTASPLNSRVSIMWKNEKVTEMSELGRDANPLVLAASITTYEDWANNSTGSI